MSRPAILVENIGKSYNLGRRTRSFPTFREALMDSARSRLRRLSGRGGDENSEPFWALKDVSLEVKPGEVVGIIGRNGAGKSTLLKILSRITEPTEGCVRVRGRLASLLEVGTGFHPELTGRENVYLNGSILGMKKSEINRKFDQIVAFAEIEQFLDTQVKHYSSGMYVRLAFSVAAHLEPQILIVDEVLAVGDAAFQKKCLGRIEEVTQEGRTVLFVSHNMPAVQNLCTRCVLLERGRLKMDGAPAEVLTAYNRSTAGKLSDVEDLTRHHGRTPHSIPTMKRVRVSPRDGGAGGIHMGDDVRIEVTFEASKLLADVTLGVQVKNSLQVPVFGINTSVIPPGPLEKPVQRGMVSCLLKQIPLMPGTYNLDLYFGSYDQNFDVIHEACQFEVLPADVFGSGKIPPATSGSVFWPAVWTVTDEEEQLPVGDVEEERKVGTEMELTG